MKLKNYNGTEIECRLVEDNDRFKFWNPNGTPCLVVYTKQISFLPKGIKEEYWGFSCWSSVVKDRLVYEVLDTRK